MTSALKKPRSDFSKRENESGDYDYDPVFDRDLIEASFAAQYGIRLAQEPNISYAEWARLLAGIMPETPLGQVVGIRAEKDPKAIARFGRHERKIRAEWARFKAGKQSMHKKQLDMRRLQETLQRLFTPV